MESVLDIDLLRTFHAVARLGKFRSAAEFVSKSPAAISTHIQRLEAIAGGRLLDRDNQSVTLTALGKRLLASTNELLNAHDRVLQEIQGKTLGGRIVLGVPDEYAAHVIRDILPSFTSNWPNVVMEVRTAPSLKLRDWVTRGKLDLALLVQPARATRPADVLTMTTPVWVGGSGYVWDDSRPLPLALYGEPCPYRVAMMNALERAGRRWRVVLDSASSQVIKSCVESGLAVTLLDRARVSEDMKVLDMLPRIGDHEVVLMRDRAGRASEAIDLLVTTVKQHFRL
nr:LysR substrate-binding domain-containing protein [Caballeronia fortuita]